MASMTSQATKICTKTRSFWMDAGRDENTHENVIVPVAAKKKGQAQGWARRMMECSLDVLQRYRSGILKWIHMSTQKAPGS
jgi:hypothetical protein